MEVGRFTLNVVAPFHDLEMWSKEKKGGGRGGGGESGGGGDQLSTSIHVSDS